MIMKPITILLAEDHIMVRDGLRALLELQPDMEVVAEAANGREASWPDSCVLMWCSWIFPCPF